MGSSLDSHATEEKEDLGSPLTLEELFEMACIDYMSIGMTYDEFYRGDAKLPRIYREAHYRKTKAENDKINHELWLQSQYLYETLHNIAPAFNPYIKGKPKGSIPKPYEFGKTTIESKNKSSEKVFAESLKDKQAQKEFEGIQRMISEFNKGFNERKG